MTIDDLRDLLLAAPTAGAADSALATLLGLAGDGHTDAIAALQSALAQALGAPDGSAAPASLRAWLAAWQPRDFLATAAALAAPSTATDADPAAPQRHFAALQQLVRSRHVLQHEALKAQVLAALAAQIEMTDTLVGLTPGRMLPVLDRVCTGTRVVEGADANDKLQFGRDLLLGLPSPLALTTIIDHELAHPLLDLLQRRGAAAPASDDAAQRSAGLALAAAVPALLHAACAHRDQPIVADDPRCLRMATGVRLLCTHRRLQRGAYFHLSLTQDGGPIDATLAARCAQLVLRAAGADPAHAAVAWSARGVWHVGFVGDDAGLPTGAAPPADDVARWVDGAAAAGDAWLADLRLQQRLGNTERDLPVTLGVQPPQPRVHAADAGRAAADLNLLAQAAAAGLRSQPLHGLSEPQARALLVAAWRCADAALMHGLLAAWPALAAVLRAAPWPLGEIGSSLCAQCDPQRNVQGDAQDCAVFGATAADILATLQALHLAGVPLDAPADVHGRPLLLRAAGLPTAASAGLVRSLLACGVAPDAAGADGDTPLHAAVDAGRQDVAALLLGAGAMLEARDALGATALHRAAARGHDTLLQWLLAQGAAADATDSQGHTPLMAARSAAAAEALLAAAAQANAATLAGDTALTLAAARGGAAVPVLQVLLAHGADLDHADRLGATALHRAAVASGGAAAVDLLLGAGADPDDETTDGLTPLMVAARSAHAQAMARLLAGGANANARSVNGQTALILAADGRNEPTRDPSFHSRIEQVLAALVRAGADINAANHAGVTALHAATWGFDAGRVRCLLGLGANPHTRAANGSTPLAQAQAQGHTAMTAMLQAALANTPEPP